MNSSLIEHNLNEDYYDEYIEKIVNIFRLSSKSSSILFHLEIKDYKANITLSIVNQNGEREEFSDVVMKCDEVFYHSFLIPFVKKVCNEISIQVKDIVDLDKDSLFTFRMITDNNDLLTVDGLSNDDAKSLLNIAEKPEVSNVSLSVSNDKGIGNILVFLLTLLVLGLVFSVLILLLTK